MFAKNCQLRDSNPLPGVFITGESVPNMDNSTNKKKLKIISGHAYLNHEKLLDEKNQR
jgi:hypothetical protein